MKRGGEAAGTAVTSQGRCPRLSCRVYGGRAGGAAERTASNIHLPVSEGGVNEHATL